MLLLLLVVVVLMMVLMLHMRLQMAHMVVVHCIPT